MANVVTTTKISVDTAGTVRVPNPPTKVTYIVFTPAATGDAMVLRETSGGADIMTVQAAVAEQTVVLDFSIKPILFNGIHIQSIDSGAKATIVFTSEGSGN